MGEIFHAPPSQPPPLLSDDQILSLAQSGWLSILLPRHLEEGLSALARASTEFFKNDPRVKADLYPRDQGTEKGFYPIENEKEYLTLRCRVHVDSELELLAAQVWQDTAAFLHRILCDLAREMDLSQDVWDSILDGCLSLPDDADQMTPSLLRLFRYYSGAGSAAEHTDLGLLTLCIGDGRGLQGFDQSPGQAGWVDAGGAMILIGDTLRMLSGRRVRAGRHRVVKNPTGRSSVVFALRPSLRHPIDLRRFGVGEEVGADELWKDIQSKKFNINAIPDIRDRQKLALQKRIHESGTNLDAVS